MIQQIFGISVDCCVEFNLYLDATESLTWYTKGVRLKSEIIVPQAKFALNFPLPLTPVEDVLYAVDSFVVGFVCK